MSTVYILGSGFSKAINENMPTLTELSISVAEKFQKELDEFPLSKYIGNVEELLTYLYAEHPWKDISTIHRDKALYYEISYYVQNVIEEKQFPLVFNFGNSKNDSIQKLVSKWNDNNSCIISFNYDTIVEAYLNNLRQLFNNPNQLMSIWRIPIVNIKERIGKISYGDYVVISPSLIKLHGSVNWYLNGNIDNQYSNLYYDDNTFVHPIAILDYYVVDTHEKAGLVPFIIPPVIDKSVFYKNTFLKKLWADASYFLGAADKIVMIGYSIPETDYPSQMLFKSAIRDETEIVIVNTNTRKEFTDRMKNIFGSRIKDNFKYCCDNALFEYINNEIQ